MLNSVTHQEDVDVVRVDAHVQPDTVVILATNMNLAHTTHPTLALSHLSEVRLQFEIQSQGGSRTQHHHQVLIPWDKLGEIPEQSNTLHLVHVEESESCSEWLISDWLDQATFISDTNLSSWTSWWRTLSLVCVWQWLWQWQGRDWGEWTRTQ